MQHPPQHPQHHGVNRTIADYWHVGLLLAEMDGTKAAAHREATDALCTALAAAVTVEQTFGVVQAFKDALVRMYGDDMWDVALSRACAGMVGALPPAPRTAEEVEAVHAAGWAAAKHMFQWIRRAVPDRAEMRQVVERLEDMERAVDMEAAAMRPAARPTESATSAASMF